MGENQSTDIKTIFAEALEKLTPTEQAAYLEQACGGNAELRSQVEALLAAHDRAGSFLAIPLSEAKPTLDEPPGKIAVGTTIGRYQLLELIGEGGMGLVYLADQKEPVRRRVAFKIIKPGMDSRQVIARFEAERQALALLDHPNIAHILDAGCAETGRPYFVMEYVRGMSVTRYCDENKLTIEQRLRLFEQVCEAVQHAHTKGIIHRDLKPSNILVCVHGDRATPKIIDFGIAKAVSQPLTDKTYVTFQGQLLGTPEYMSPEQVDFATQDIDTRSDIYALGVILYELLAGVLPFESEFFERAGLAQIQQTIREQEPVSPSRRLTSLGEKAHAIAASRNTQAIPLARRLHRELEWIPLKAMRKDRCRRYRSASEMADDIRNYLNGLPLIAGPETTIYRMQKFVHKHAGSVATVSLVAAAIILGLVVSTVMYFRADDARRKETIARTRAEQAEQTTKDKAEELRHTLYVNSIQLADAKYREGNIGRVRELLSSCPADLRGWEWNHLNYISDRSTMAMNGHDDPITQVVLSRDGKHVVSSSNDETVRIWNLDTGSEVMTLRWHSDEVQCVAISPDGNRIASGAHDGIKVWDASTGSELMTLRGHPGGVSSVDFSPDGRKIVSGGYDGTVKIWDAPTGKELATHHGHDYVFCVRFSPDGKRMASAGGDKIVRLWDAETGAEVKALSGHTDRVFSIAFDPQGGRLVSVGEDKTIRFWDVESGNELMIIPEAHKQHIWCVAFSRDGQRVVSGGYDNAIKVWDAATGAELLSFPGQGGWISSVLFCPDSERIISATGASKAINVWDASTNRERMTLRSQGYNWLAGFSADGRRLMAYDRASDRISILNATDGAEIMTLRGHNRRLESAVVSPDGKRVASTKVDNTIEVWDADTGTDLWTLHRREGTDLRGGLAFTRDGKHVLASRADNTFTALDTETGAELTTFRGHTAWVVSIVCSPNGRWIASGDLNGAIKIWDAATGTEVATVQTHEPFGLSMAFSPDSRRLASAGIGGAVTLWDVDTAKEIKSLHGHMGAVSSIAFSPDGKRIVSAGWLDTTVRVWDAATGEELLTLHLGKERGPSGMDRVDEVVFSPDGQTLALGGGGTVGVILLEGTVPPGGYGRRTTIEAARRIVDHLHDKHGSYHKAAENISPEGIPDERVRQMALQIAVSSGWRDAEKLSAEARNSVDSPGKNVTEYQAALANAEQANRWEPNDAAILETMAAAQYRTGSYEAALKTLKRVERLRADDGNERDPRPLAFTAMASHQLGWAGEAKSTLEQLRALLKDKQFADDDEAKAYLAEAEGLIESGNKP